MTRILTCFLAVLFVAASARAEMIKEVSMNSIADNNIFGTSDPTSDYLTEASTYVANAFSGEGFDTRLFYQGSGYLFASEGNRSFTTQEVGIAHARKLGEGRNQLYTGASFLTRIGHTDYNVYDYAGMRAFLNGKFYAAPKTMLRAGYHLATRNYWNLDTASYADHYLFGQITQFLPTKTTLQGDLSYSYKTHFSDEAQIVLGAQIAQSVRPGTGLSLRYQRRVNTLAPSADLTLDGFSLDEDILVDRYDYSGHQVTSKLTQQLPLRATMVLSGGYETQTYDDQAALDADSLPVSDLATRLDKITFGQVSLDVPLWNRLDLGIDYRIEKSLSNDAFYDYDGRRSFSVAIGLEF
jgi:hypothetical protein